MLPALPARQLGSPCSAERAELRCAAPDAARSGQEFAHQLDELVSFLDFRTMAATVENGDLYVGIVQCFAISLGRADRHNRVLASPDNLCGQAADTFKKMRQHGIVQDRLPGQPRVLGARVLKGFELLRRSLAAIELV